MSKIRSQHWLIILMIALLGINITYPTAVDVPRFNSNTYTSLLLTVWVALLYFGIRKKIVKKILKFDWVAGVIFASLYCATFVASNILNSNYLNSGINVLFNLLSWVSWIIVFSVTFAFIRTCFGTTIPKITGVPKGRYLWAILSIIWVVSIIYLLPGQISWDGLKQFCEFEGTHISQLGFTYSPTNHHPWFTTLFFGTLFNIGRSIFGVNFGIFTIVVTQFIISSIIYTYVIKYVWTTVGKIGGIITLALFASPIFSSYIATVDKSTLYYAFSAWFYLCFAKLYEGLNNKTWSYKDIFLYIFSATLAGLFRNDAFLIVIITTVLLIILTLRSKKKLFLALVSLVVILGIHLGWNVILTRDNVVKSSPSEALTIPIRQLSYVYMTDPDSFSKTELKTINKITPLSKIKENYDINNGDSLKSLYPSDTFLNSASIIKDVVSGKKTLNTTSNEKKETVDYLKLWLSAGIKHPKQYVKVYLGANSRYLNPFIMYEPGLFLNYYSSTPNSMPIFIKPSWYNEYHSLFNGHVREKGQQVLMMLTMFPPLAIVGNPATLLWIALLLLLILLKVKDWKGIVFLLPLLIMCMLFTVTSINGYTRYTIGALAASPIVISCLWKKRYDAYQMMKEK